MGKFSFDEGRHIVISFYSEGFSYYNLGYNPHVKLPAKSWLYKGLTNQFFFNHDKNGRVIKIKYWSEIEKLQ